MKAILLKEFGEVGNLQPAKIDVPAIQDNEVLVQVKDISINPVYVKKIQDKDMAVRKKKISHMIIC